MSRFTLVREPPPTQSTQERRRDKRFALARPGKLFRRSTGRFVAAESRNVSLGGARLNVHTERPLAVGELVEVGLDLSNSRGVVRTDSLVDGIVVRAEPAADNVQEIAVRYLGREALAAAA